MATNWTDVGKEKITGVLIGIEHLPAPIKTHMRRTFQSRPAIKHVYHVTELLYCLRKAYYRRMASENSIDDMGTWNIYRGNTFDNRWSPLFDKNQITLKSERKNITITGTLDFVWYDEKNMEKVLYDLKMPKNVYYRKSGGAGKFYTAQVQVYLAMAHENGELMDVHRCRVMMVADDLVIDEVPQKDEILDILWDRAYLLDEALETKNPSKLKGPEDSAWECREDYCPGTVEWRIACKDETITEGYPIY